jgi:regulator of nonsense transcripts 3
VPTTTPLLEALKAEKSAHKDKESILRNHAHYKEQQIATPQRKDEPKKKNGSIPGPKVVPTTTNGSHVTTPGGGGGKKSHKKGQVPAALPPATAPKIPVQNNTAAKNPNVTPVTGATPKSPKALRAPRLPPQTTAPSGGTSTPEVPVVALPTQGTQRLSPRRPRPVVGLGSRQFEVALNGAGVSSPGDRKSRREREMEEEREKEVGGASVTSSGVLVPAPQATPRRDRGGKKEAAQAQASGSAGAAGGTPSDLPKVSGILQRDAPLAPGVIMRTETNGATVSAQNGGAPPFHGGRGGRRGRGGKGRGARGG